MRAQPKKGGLRCWHSAKQWGSQVRTQPERVGGGGARCGYKPEIGICKKRGSYRN